MDHADALRDDRVARWSATLASTGLAFDLTSNIGAIHWTQLAGIVVTATTALVLWLRRDQPSLRRANIAFVVINLAVIGALWVSSQRLAESGVNWVPFRPHHLGVLAVALLAPSRAWVGIVSILAFTAAALIQFALFGPDVRAHLPYGDPWATLAYGGFGIGLLIFRLRGNRIEQQITIANTRVAELERFARTMLAVRDLTNTPLQTLELLAGMLRAGATPTAEVAERIERAVARMKQVDGLASEYDGEIGWVQELVSFDPMELLQAARPLSR